MPDLIAIMGRPQASAAQLDTYLRKRDPKVPPLGVLYIEEGEQEGVRGDGAFAQMIKETGALSFGGLAKPHQNNFCGLGVTGSLIINGLHGHMFKTPLIGVRVHIQHLKAYGSTDPLVLECVDPRFGLVKRGSAEYFEWLGKADNPNGVGWAWPGRGYGYDVVRILDNILKTEPEPAPAVGVEEYTIEEQLITGPNRPGTPLAVKEIVVHRTGNNSPGADARAHYRYFNKPLAGRGPASSHYFVDDKLILRIIPDDEQAYHCRGANEFALGIELCEHKEIEFEPAYWRLVWLVAVKCVEFGLHPLKHVSGHYFYSPVNRASDPVGLFNWLYFLGDVCRAWEALRIKRSGPFVDVPPDHWAAEYFRRAKEDGVVLGTPDGRVEPDRPVTRAEALAMLYRVLDRKP